MLFQEHSSLNLDGRQTSSAVLYHLEIFVWKRHVPKEILNGIWKICSNILSNVGTFGANLWKLFPNLCIRHSKVGQETWKLGARMNRFDYNTVSSLETLLVCHGVIFPVADLEEMFAWFWVRKTSEKMRFRPFSIKIWKFWLGSRNPVTRSGSTTDSREQSCRS